MNANRYRIGVEHGWLRPFQVLGMFVLTCIGWLIFRETELRQLVYDLMLTPDSSESGRLAGGYLFLLVFLYSIPLWIHDLWAEAQGPDLVRAIDAPETSPRWAEWRPRPRSAA